MRAMIVTLLAAFAGLWLSGCTEEGKPNRARQSTTDRLLQEQQLDQERQRIQKEGQQQSLPPTIR
jgi:hypothetical protein